LTTGAAGATVSSVKPSVAVALVLPAASRTRTENV
jgi:hypothetical protein